MDIGIITVLESELEAILTYIPRYGTVSGRRQYNMCRLETQQGDTYEIAVARSLESGTGEATELARDLLEELSPTWLFVVGIAGGVKGQVAVGDVVVSSRIADITKETVLSDEIQYSVGGGPIAHDAAIIIANLPALKLAMQGWDDVRIPRPIVNLIKIAPRVITGTIASSDRLVRDAVTIEGWRGQIRGLKASRWSRQACIVSQASATCRSSRSAASPTSSELSSKKLGRMTAGTAGTATRVTSLPRSRRRSCARGRSHPARSVRLQRRARRSRFPL